MWYKNKIRKKEIPGALARRFRSASKAPGDSQEMHGQISKFLLNIVSTLAIYSYTCSFLGWEFFYSIKKLYYTTLKR